MSFFDFFQDIAIVLYIFGSRITNRIGLVGAVLLIINAVLKILYIVLVLQRYDLLFLSYILI